MDALYALSDTYLHFPQDCTDERGQGFKLETERRGELERLSSKSREKKERGWGWKLNDAKRTRRASLLSFLFKERLITNIIGNKHHPIEAIINSLQIYRVVVYLFFCRKSGLIKSSVLHASYSLFEMLRGFLFVCFFFRKLPQSPRINQQAVHTHTHVRSHRAQLWSTGSHGWIIDLQMLWGNSSRKSKALPEPTAGRWTDGVSVQWAARPPAPCCTALIPQQQQQQQECRLQRAD